MSPLLPRRRVPSPRARFLRLSFASMGSNEKHLLLCLSPLSVPVIVCLFGLLQTGARDVARKVAPLVAPGRLTSPRAAASLRAANVCAQITGFTCQATHAESRQVYSVRDRRFYEQWEVSVQADPVDYRRGSRAQYQIIFDAADLRIRTLNRVQEEEDANAADPVIAEEQAPRPQGGRSSQMSRAQADDCARHFIAALGLVRDEGQRLYAGGATTIASVLQEGGTRRKWTLWYECRTGAQSLQRGWPRLIIITIDDATHALDDVSVRPMSSSTSRLLQDRVLAHS